MDEPIPIVIDDGSHTMHAGFGGDDHPRFSMRAHAAVSMNDFLLDTEITKHGLTDLYTGGYTLVNAKDNTGAVADWEIQDKVYIF